jgi:hypothetical protein
MIFMAKDSGKPYSPATLLSFSARFPGESACWKFLIKSRWPDGFCCPHCGGAKHCFSKRRKLFECYGCRKRISPTAGTMFHGSRIPLRKWYWAIFLIATSKKGVPALYLQKQLGIGTYRAAWLMGQKIRQAMIQRDARYTLDGTVETDEIFIGGKQTFEERREFGPNKTPFLMMVEETKNGGPHFLSFEELETIYEEHVLPALEKNVQKGSKIKSDGAGVYMKTKGYQNDRVVTQKDPEKGHDHLFWVNMLTSNLKRFLLSTHHGVHRKYRKAYLAEFAYRFNRRSWTAQAFDRLLYSCVMAEPVNLRHLKA